MRRAGPATAVVAAFLAAAVPAWSGDEQRQAPVAELRVAPANVVAGEPVVLDGSGSRDPDGAVTSYAWDLDGDGAFERVSGAEARLGHVFEEAGERSIGLRVVDDSGESGDATATVTVAEPPEPEPEPKAAAAPPEETMAPGERTRSASEPRAESAEDGGAGSDKPRERAPAPAKEDRLQAAASATVSIRDFSFAPRSVTVNVGDTVTWRNVGDEPHTATGSGFDTGILNKGQSGSATFRTAGTFNYKCTPHPFMTASVTVRGSGSGGGGGGSGSGGSGDGTAGTSQDPGSGDASASDGDSLPSTGLALGSVVLTGLLMVAGGLVLRRRVAWPGT